MPAGRIYLLSLARRCAAVALVLCAGAFASAAGAATGAKNFDHTSTGFPLTGQHENARCEDCHVRGIFKGTPTQCAACHVQGGFVTAVFFPNNHFPIPAYPNGVAGARVSTTNGLQVPLTTPCSDCHTTQSFDGAHFSHAAVVPGTCNACHNARYALKAGPFAKTANHIKVAANVSCDQCHTTASFGTSYMALPMGHMPTGQPCSTCHNGASFVPGVMNHVGTAGTCTQCHAPSATPYSFTLQSVMINGVKVDVTQNGLPVTVVPMSQGGLNANRTSGAVNHIPAGASCDQCHANGNFTPGSAFKGGVMRHAAVAGASCSSCHNVPTVFAGTGPGSGGQPFQIPGVVGTPGTANHIPVNGLDCAASGCHAASDAATATGIGFATKVTPALSAAGHASVNLACQSCHTVGMTWKLDTATMVTPASTHIPPDNLSGGTVACAGCHSSTSFGSGGFKITTTPLLSVSGHTTVATLTCATCHESGDRQPQDLLYQGISAAIYLRPNTASSGLSKGAGLDPYHGSGIGLSQDCATCHSTTPPFSSAIVPSGHIKLVTPTPNCNDCHSAGYAPGASKMKHSDVVGTCTSCHNTTTAYLGSGQGTNGQPWQIPGTVGTPGSGNHIPVGALDCAASGCHGNTTANDTMSATGAGFVLSTTPQLSANGHTSVNLPCQTCHTLGMAWKGVTTLVTPTSAHVPPDGVSTGTLACSSCHSPTNFTSGGFKIAGTLGTLTGGGTGTTTNASVMSVASHSAVAATVSSCATCHEAGLTTFQGVGTSIFLRPDKGSASGASNGADAAHGVGNAATADCASCHNPTSFTGGLPSNHIKLITPTPACSDCHAAGYGPGLSGMKHTDVTGTCTSCHYTATVFSGTGQGTNGQPWQIPGTVGTPGTGNHLPINGLDCAASGCHAVSDALTATGAGFVTGTTPSLSATGHTTITSGLTCSACHAVGMAWKGVTILAAPTSLHIPPDNASAGTLACSGCHAVNNFNTGGWKIAGTLGTLTGGGTGTTTNASVMSVASHSAVAATVSSCATCHEAGLTTFQGVATSIFLRPDKGSASGASNGADAAHGVGNAATADCASCHNPTSFTGGLPSNHIKLITPTPACSDCHAAGYGPGLSGMKHTDVTGTCTSCHYTATVFSGTGQGTNGQPWQIPGTVGTPGTGNHLPINGLDCAASGCHAVSDALTATGAGFVTGTTPSLSATGHTTITSGLTCSACHAVGMAWKGVTILAAPTSLHIPPDNASAGTLACSGCHAVNNFNTGGWKIAGTLGTLTGGGTGTTTNASVMSVASHSAVAATVSSCATCHEAGLTTFQGVATSIFLRPDKGSASGASNGADAAHGVGNAATADCASCHNPTSFTGGLPSNHIKLITPTPACSDCHAAGYGPGLSGMKHTDVTGTCTSCHYTATVFSGTGQGTNGQPWQIPGTVGTPGTGNHLPINGLDCAASGCHAVSDALTATGAGFKTGLTPALSAAGHTSITAGVGCQACHNVGMAWFGVTALITPDPGGKHIPPDNTSSGSMACSGCHAPTSFGTGGFKITGTLGTLTGGGTGTTTNASVMSIGSHSAVAATVSSCATCHEAGLTTFQGVGTSIFLRPDKGSASGASNGADTAHGTGTAATGDCSGCHSPSSFAGGLPTNHMPVVSGAACTSCHTNGTSNPVTPTAMPHTGFVTGTCASCHNAATAYAGPVFTPSTTGPGGTFGTYTSGQVAFTPRQIVSSPPVGASGGHIPLPAGDDCSVCHTVFTGFGPGTAMVHTGITSSCATCHAAGAKWYGETYTASPLVTTSNVTLSPLHVPISTSANPACEVCHSTTVFTSFGTTTKVNHTNGAFMAYSNGGTTDNKNAAGKSLPTCVSCHAPSGTKWYNASLSTATMGSHQNSAKTDDCIMCHNVNSFGGAAAAAAFGRRPMAHASGGGVRRPVLPGLTGAPAGTAAPAVASFTHVGVAPGACASCHGTGGTAPPKPAGHLPTMLSCDTCHRTSTWLPALFTHNGVLPGTCSSCHAGNWATAKPAKHMLSSRTCDTCHRGTASWTPQTYSHLDMVYSPHPSSVTCVSCHTTETEQVTWKYPNFKPGCAGCHGPQFSAPHARRSHGPATPAPRGAP